MPPVRLEDLTARFSLVQVNELIPGRDRFYLLVIPDPQPERHLRDLRRALRAHDVNCVVVNSAPIQIFEIPSQAAAVAVAQGEHGLPLASSYVDGGALTGGGFHDNAEAGVGSDEGEPVTSPDEHEAPGTGWPAGEWPPGTYDPEEP